MILLKPILVFFLLGLTFCYEPSGLELDNQEVVPENPEVAEVDAKTDDVELDKAAVLESLPSYINLTEATTPNLTVAVSNVTEVKNASTENLVSCLPHVGTPEINIVNDTELIKLLLPDANVTTKETPGNCIVIMFYSKYCPFSSLAAPHFNALPRAFPTFKMVAINAMWYHIFNAQNGVVGVPSILLFHNGKPVAKFNESDYTLELFSKFITKNTGVNAEEKSFVTSADFSGPVVSVPLKEDDMFLLASWVFVLACAAYYFSKSRFWKWIVEMVQNTWRESEAQHEHEE